MKYFSDCNSCKHNPKAGGDCEGRNTKAEVERCRSNILGIKPSTYLTLKRYAENRIPTGGFLKAVLSNDLFEAVGRADWDNRKSLHEICSHIYNNLPAGCWGSEAIVETWLEGKE